jgi:hypothetical protein
MGNSLAIKTCVFGFSVANADSSMENFLTYCNTHKLKNNIFKIIILKESLELRKLSINGRYLKPRQRAKKEYRVHGYKTDTLIKTLNEMGFHYIKYS